MAAIGKIRSWGPVLATVIGLALFAFIAEEMFRSCEATGNERRQQVGEVLGKKISVQEFQTLTEEFQEYMKVAQNRDNFSSISRKIRFGSSSSAIPSLRRKLRSWV